MERIVYQGTLLKSEATIGQTACTWENVSGVLPPSSSTSENPQDYKFILNGVEYQCNYFLHGDTKFKASYKTQNHDTIMLEYLIATGLSTIKIRTDDDFEVLDSNTFKFIENVDDVINQKALIRFSKDIAFLVGADGTIKGV